MKVFVAGRRTQGELENDFAWTLDGELVHLEPLGCWEPDRCGCNRAFAGVASHRGTTTAEIAERELDREDVVVAVARSLADGGWFDDPSSQDAVDSARELVDPLLDVAATLPVGTVVRRQGTRLYTLTPREA